MRSLVGIDGVAEANIVPLSGRSWANWVWPEGENRQAGFDPNFNTVGSGYYQTLGTPLLAGRDFNDQDTASSATVATLNQEFARRLGRGPNPIGLRVRREARPHEPEMTFEIIGVVKNTKYSDLRQAWRPIVYLPISQSQDSDSYPRLLVHSALPLADLTFSLKRAVDGVSPVINLNWQVFKTQIRESLHPERLMAALSVSSGYWAALLTAVGLYGVISFLVAQRAHEIGIRMALGARRSQVLASILRETLTLTALGVAVGLPMTFFVERLIGSMLFGVNPGDPQALALAVLALGIVSVAAACIPARRAASVDPMIALRDE